MEHGDVRAIPACLCWCRFFPLRWVVLAWSDLQIAKESDMALTFADVCAKSGPSSGKESLSGPIGHGERGAIPTCLWWCRFLSTGRGCTECPANRQRELHGSDFSFRLCEHTILAVRLQCSKHRCMPQFRQKHGDAVPILQGGGTGVNCWGANAKRTFHGKTGSFTQEPFTHSGWRTAGGGPTREVPSLILARSPSGSILENHFGVLQDINNFYSMALAGAVFGIHH